MRVAEITCLTRMVRLPDLDLELVKGQTATLSAEQVEASSDLAMMRRLNAVQVHWVRKPDLRVVESPPSPRRLTLLGHVRTTPPVTTPISPTTSPGVDLEALADKLAERMNPAVDRIVRAVKESGGQQVVITSAGRSPSGELPSTVAHDVTPAFIPDKIIDHNAKADIQTKKTTSADSSVAAAAAALKKARKTKET